MQIHSVEFSYISDASMTYLDSGPELAALAAMPLESSLQLYERGVQLSRYCHGRLEEAERRIEILNERGQLKPAPATLTSDDESKV